MRSILGGLLLIMLPSLASAECQCACMNGKSVPVCQPQAMVEPICQQICPDKVEQSLGTMGIGGAAAPGAAAGGIGGGGASGMDRSMSNAAMGR
jgi:hypothetical protein